MSEQVTQKFISDYLDSIGTYSFKVIKANRAGVHDIVGCKKKLITQDMVGKEVGLFFTLEVKTDKGVVSELQKYHMNLVHKAGGFSWIVRSVQDVKDQFKEMICN